MTLNDRSPHLYDYLLNDKGEVYAIREQRTGTFSTDPAAAPIRSPEAEFATKTDRWLSETIEDATRKRLIVKQQQNPDPVGDLIKMRDRLLAGNKDLGNDVGTYLPAYLPRPGVTVTDATGNPLPIKSWTLHTTESGNPASFGNEYFIPMSTDDFAPVRAPRRQEVTAEFTMPLTDEMRDAFYGTPEERLKRLDSYYERKLRRVGPRSIGKRGMAAEYQRERQAILDEITARDSAESSRHEMAARLVNRNWFNEFQASQPD